MLSGLRFKLLGLQVGCYCRVWWWHHFQKFVIMAQLAHALGVLESEPAESETLSLQHLKKKTKTPNHRLLFF